MFFNNSPEHVHAMSPYNKIMIQLDSSLIVDNTRINKLKVFLRSSSSDFFNLFI